MYKNLNLERLLLWYLYTSETNPKGWIILIEAIDFYMNNLLLIISLQHHCRMIHINCWSNDDEYLQQKRVERKTKRGAHFSRTSIFSNCCEFVSKSGVITYFFELLSPCNQLQFANEVTKSSVHS